MAGPAPQARPHAPWLRRLTLALALAAPGVAHAGAWITADEDQTITTFGYGRDDEGVATLESDVFAETPIGSRYALVGHTLNTRDTLGQQRDEADIDAKVAAYRGRRLALALQTGVTWRAEPLDGCGEVGGEARALAGLSSRSGRSFVNGEAAIRVASGGCAHVRYELTAGLRRNARWLGLGQIFVDDDLAFGETIKAQASLVRFSRKGRGLQLSLRLRVDDGAVTEPTLILGYWSAARR